MAEDEENELLSVAVASLENGVRAAAGDRPDLWQYPLHCLPALTRCRRVLYSTKGEWLFRVAPGGLPADVTFLWRYGPLAPVHRRLVRSILEQHPAPLEFVGDLDPLDIATFATLVAEPDVLLGSYLGVADPWLLRCEADLAERGGWTFPKVCIQMDAGERAGLDRLLRLPMDWTRVIGKRAMLLLGTGFKLELEGATHPDLYSAAFNEALRHELFQSSPDSRP